VAIADRLRALREQKKLSRGDLEKRTGFVRSYISRVENGHIVPTIESLEKMARAVEVLLYQLFYDGEKLSELPHLPNRRVEDDTAWGHSGKDGRVLDQFRRLLSRMAEKDRRLLLFTAQKMASQNKVRPRAKVGRPQKVHRRISPALLSLSDN
jgi:transcriptional regulator with XRE-family HTH domain